MSQYLSMNRWARNLPSAFSVLSEIDYYLRVKEQIVWAAHVFILEICMQQSNAPFSFSGSIDTSPERVIRVMEHIHIKIAPTLEFILVHQIAELPRFCPAGQDSRRSAKTTFILPPYKYELSLHTLKPQCILHSQISARLPICALGRIKLSGQGRSYLLTAQLYLNLLMGFQDNAMKRLKFEAFNIPCIVL